jgi:hypothetical protein
MSTIWLERRARSTLTLDRRQPARDCLAIAARYPHYRRKRLYGGRQWTSQKCHDLTCARQQMAPSLDHLVGAEKTFPMCRVLIQVRPRAIFRQFDSWQSAAVLVLMDGRRRRILHELRQPLARIEHARLYCGVGDADDLCNLFD